MQDYYSVLGVSKNATNAEIKSAYRKLTLKWHPDRNKDPKAADEFKKINAAYEILSDESKKKQYDAMGHDTYTKTGGRGNTGYGDFNQDGPFSYTYRSGGGAGFEGFDNFDVNDIFESFFGGGFGGAGRARKQVYQISISFEDAYNGVEKEVTIGNEKRKLKIPAGIDNGNRMRFQDFDLIVQISPSSIFRREGADLYVEKDISIALAALGGVVEVPTMKGPLKLKIRPGTQSETAVRLRGEGMPVPNMHGKGDLYIVYKVKVPEKLNGRAKRLLEELLKEL